MLTRMRVLLVSLVAAVIGLTVGSSMVAPSEATAISGSEFSPGYIISDERFFDARAMDESGVQAFLERQVPSCVGANGLPCLKDARFDTSTKGTVAANHCSEYAGAASERASRIIAKVAVACRINPQVLLTMLQKEQGLVTASSPTERQYRVAMGYGCPDTAPCEAEFYGFFNQVYKAAWQLRQYTAFPNRTYRIGTVPVQYHPNAGCGAPMVNIRNQATANLYNYTPYQPNAAALSNLRGTGDGCSSYGNRNFWVNFSDWFGSPTGSESSFGSFDQIGVTYRPTDATINVRGWAFDPAASRSVIDVHVHIQRVGGHLAIETVRAGSPRPDVGAVYPDAGPDHGFSAELPMTQSGDYRVCVFAIRASGAVPIGCKDQRVEQTPPIGSVDSLAITMTGPTAVIRASGWVIDHIDPTSARRVDVWLKAPDGRWSITSGTAGTSRPDVGAVYPAAGANHGFTVDVPLTAPGAYVACVFGIGTPYLGDNNTLFVCKDLQFGPSWPIGSLDSTGLVFENGSPRIDVRGWTLDAGLPSAPTSAHIWVTDPSGVQSARTLAADQPNGEVGRVYPTAGPNHAYQGMVDVTAQGTYGVCAYGIGTSALPYAVRSLGCNRVVFGPTSPQGAFDTATPVTDAGGRRIDISGWAYDRGLLQATTAIDMWVTHPDGHLSATHFVADRTRPDVAAVFPDAGPQRGVAGSIQVHSAGRHQVCAYSITATDLGSGASFLGCKFVDVG